MDWFKQGTKYILSPEFTLIDIGAISKLLALVALYERMPTEKEMTKIVSPKLMEGVSQKLSKVFGTTLAEVLEKGCEDTSKYQKVKTQNKQRKQAQRDREIQAKPVTRDVTLQRREEKRREEKKEEVKKSKNAHAFELSPVYDKDKWVSCLIDKGWSESEALEYWDKADNYSNKGNKYKDWVKAVCNWKNKEISLKTKGDDNERRKRGFIN